MKKKYIYLIILVSIFSGYLFLSNTINKYDSYRTLKQYFPQEVRTFVKKTLFFYKYQKHIEKKLADAERKNVNNSTKQEFVQAVNERKKINLIEDYGYINFKKNAPVLNYEIDGRKIIIQDFKTDAISVPKYEGLGTAYLEYNDNKLFFISAHGLFSYVEIDKFTKDSFKAKVIKSNIQDLIKYDRFYVKSMYGIKDALISKNKIFISYLKQEDSTPTEKWRNNCYSTSILVADLNYEYLEFKEFFSPDMCIKEIDERYIEFLAHQSGGRIAEFKNNKLLFTIGDFRTYAVSQEKDNFFGKIISIDFDGKNPKIVSMGHRNPQGLFYDKNNDIIFSTEHGPDGGDEVNHNINTNDDKIENFGWAISSYGDHHYNYKNYQKEKLFPLYKSHSKYGFEEPLTYFYPSIGISEIVKIKNNQDDLESYNLLVASMGKDIEEGDLSLHYIKTDKYFKIIDQKILEIGQRIRDMIYVEKLNKVFMFFETSASVGFFTLQ